MRLVIVTVYNSLNPGSFLQATSLYNSLKANGYEVAFLKTGARNIKKQVFVETLYMLKKCAFSAALQKITIGSAYSKILRRFNVVTLEECDFEKDIFILGSDEIWNVERKNMADFPVFWGEGLPLERCISYAPSLNNAAAEQLEKYDFVSKALQGMYKISVRDEYSRDVLESISHREIKLVGDPSTLITLRDYIGQENECKEKDYVLIYIYNKAISKDETEAIIRFAREKNKKIISFGSEYKWCDKNVKGSPYDFLSYVHRADYVCTSTFHGTMFSIIYKKQFAVLGAKNKKVHELLNIFNLHNQANSESLKTILETEQNKEESSAILESLSVQSMQWLIASIKEIEQMEN